MRQRLASTWGLRLLFEPRFQLLALSLLAVIVVGFRAFQFAAADAGAPVRLRRLGLLAGRPPPARRPADLHAGAAGRALPAAGPGALPLPALPGRPLHAPGRPLPGLLHAGGLAVGRARVRCSWSRSSLWVAGAERIVADRRGRLLLLAAAFAFPPVVGELVLGNVHLQLLALFALAWWGIRRGDGRGQAVAGVAIGAAALVKVLPLLVVVWFLATGRWRAAAWVGRGGAGARRPDPADHRPRAVAGVPDRPRQHGPAGRRDRRAGARRLAGRDHRGAAGAPDRPRRRPSWPSPGAPAGRSRRPASASRWPPPCSSRRPSSTTTWRCWCCRCCWRWRRARRPAGWPSPTSSCGAASSPRWAA